MPEIKPIIRAIVDAGSYRKAKAKARAAGAPLASIGFMSQLTTRAKAAGKTLAQLLELSEEQIAGVLYGEPEDRFDVPDWAAVQRQLNRCRQTTLKMVWRRYRQQSGERAYRYSRYCELFQEWRRSQPVKAESNVHYWCGERMEIDYSGDPIEWTDFQGARHVSQLFAMALSVSKLMFFYATPDQTQRSWLEASAAALAYLGGAPSKLVCDNPKPLVRKVLRAGSQVQEALAVFCAHYNMVASPCPPGAPKCKPNAEYAVRLGQAELIGNQGLKGGWVAADRDDLNRQLKARSDEMNERVMESRGTSRRALFESEERVFLSPLPAAPFEYGEWHYATADKRHCVLVAKEGFHRYSVPPEYAGQQVTVHLTKAHVSLYSRRTGVLLGVHDRHTEERGEKTHLLKEHLTAKEAHSRLSKPDCVERLVAVGISRPTAQAFADIAWEQARSARKVCLGAVDVGKEFRTATAEEAMRRCVASKKATSAWLRKVAADIEDGARPAGAKDASEDYHTPKHGNIRGNYK